MNIFHEYPVLVPLLAGTLTELGKLIKVFFTRHQLDTDDLLQSGGMPSGHSVFVSSLAMTVFLLEGPKTTFFAIALTVATVVMYDAMKIRRAAGLHAAQLNRMLGEKKYVERLGHSPFEVLTGIVVGALIAYLLLTLPLSF